jgi:polyphosphate kinase
VDLIVRGICCLRPGIPGISERIRVRSIVGRFLEHSRIYWFLAGGAQRLYVGSADLMPRNLRGRVEVLFPIDDAAIAEQVREEVLGTYLEERPKVRTLGPDGIYRSIPPEQWVDERDPHALFIEKVQAQVAKQRTAPPRKTKTLTREELRRKLFRTGTEQTA